MKYSANKKYGLPRSRILRGKDQVTMLFKQGKRISAAHVDLRYLLEPNENGGCRAGFITGKRLGKAVLRNKIRRQLREAYRLQSHLIGHLCQISGQQLQLIFIARTADVSYQEIFGEVSHLLSALSKKTGQ